MRFDREEDVEIAGGAAAQACLAFTGKANARAVLDARRNVHRQRPLLHDAAGAVAGGAGIVDRLAAALTGVAGTLDGEEALARADLAGAAAGGAGRRLGAGLGAAARAGLAGDAGRYADLRRLAGVGLVQRHFHVVAEVRATLAARAGTRAPAAAHELAEQVVEDVRHGGREVGAETATGPPAAAFEGRVAELVVGRTLLRVLQDLVSLVQFLELLFGVLVARMPVGVAFFGEATEGGFQILLARGPRHAQNFVVVALGHENRRSFAAPPLAFDALGASTPDSCSPGRQGFGGDARAAHPESTPQEKTFSQSDHARQPKSAPRGPIHPQADFFLSSLTSSKSASTTLSPGFLASAPGSPAGPAPGCWLP